MVTESEAQALIRASFYFHELFKKTALASTPPGQFTRTQMDLMMALDMEQPLSMSTLSKRVGIAPEQTTRAIKGLRERGLVETERSEENRRVVLAHLSEQGVLFIDEHIRFLNENLQASLEGLEPDEVRQLANAANDIVSLMRKTALKHNVPDFGARL